MIPETYDIDTDHRRADLVADDRVVAPEVTVGLNRRSGTGAPLAQCRHE
jgi:hypothetical protein